MVQHNSKRSNPTTARDCSNLALQPPTKMLESLVATILNRVLVSIDKHDMAPLSKWLTQGSYVRNFDPNQLNISVWSGDIKLRDLALKKEVSTRNEIGREGCDSVRKMATIGPDLIELRRHNEDSQEQSAYPRDADNFVEDTSREMEALWINGVLFCDNVCKEPLCSALVLYFLCLLLDTSLV